MTRALRFSAGHGLVFLEVVGLRVNLACLIATRTFVDNYPTPHHTEMAMGGNGRMDVYTCWRGGIRGGGADITGDPSSLRG